jgi:hypothetical protein
MVLQETNAMKLLTHEMSLRGSTPPRANISGRARGIVAAMNNIAIQPLKIAP